MEQLVLVWETEETAHREAMRRSVELRGFRRRGLRRARCLRRLHRLQRIVDLHALRAFRDHVFELRFREAVSRSGTACDPDGSHDAPHLLGGLVELFGDRAGGEDGGIRHGSFPLV